MAALVPASGKPILSFGDMLRDLSDRRPAPPPDAEEPDSPTTIKRKKIAQLRRLFYLSDPLLSTKAGSPSRGLGTGSTQFENLNLVDAFEKAYADLIKALSEGGNEWIGFSEQLSNVLQTANQLISTAQKETRPLVDRIRSLQALVERGQSALAIAETRMSQTSHS
ncbi:uncharacterized protein [Physcomitrium patens]|uniref:Uncharacterized protein n=2 Tax=Physcomitrium patens TaxID=3218 RepID=A9T8K7_PHYPA|nr:uncharacterized protein LOC112285303 [Physcomitrium patens]PNR49640.1 hypothetical protein PHYPA_011536 [Physcomitrium patens]|eukprot:XP_024381757.1 uncharacterized protein LOC112285303 [Physcomitrella patens]